MSTSTLPDTIADALSTTRMGTPLRYRHTVGSTNADAAAWARNGAPEGAVVLAEQQTEGRGRHGRTWAAPPHQALTGSVVLRPDLPPDLFSLIPLAASLAVADAMQALALPHPPRIKWPNDVLIDGRKCCGMLLETAMRGASPQPHANTYVVLGIGLNVNQTAFPEGVDATSLRLETGQPVPRGPLWARIMQHLEARYDALHVPEQRADLRSAYADRMLYRGQSITVRAPGTDRTRTGTVVGINETGALVLDTPRGQVTFHAGEVTTRPA
ncbi:biotin--[acetyl-CoA-carboxylase] ligase [Longimonas halophila]|uniref:biotin--[biotin carboxyl-carrier protein] ligase n=2 Tax=Longimonas halophila TaxID=1469170 RepID=A0A2H3NPT2_9BACT|nr:biotin--[acetyl-CoA-carboxylase] ligase [Longimonas halophila]